MFHGNMSYKKVSKFYNLSECGVKIFNFFHFLPHLGYFCGKSHKILYFAKTVGRGNLLEFQSDEIETFWTFAPHAAIVHEGFRFFDFSFFSEKKRKNV